MTDNNKNYWLDTRNMTFKEFMEIEVNINRKLSKELLDFVIDENNKIIVNTIMKYEDGLEKQLQHFLHSRGIKCPKKMIYLNKSTHRNTTKYRNYYDKETIAIVEKLQQKTLHYFNYQY